jgi:hypothetical protein
MIGNSTCYLIAWFLFFSFNTYYLIHYFGCNLFNLFWIYVAYRLCMTWIIHQQLLGVQSWREIASGGTRTKKVEYHWCITLGINGVLDFMHRLVFYRTLENTTFRKLDVFPCSGEGWGEPTPLGPLERANLSHWNEPNRVGASPLHLRTETDPISETLCSLVSCRIPDNRQSPKPQ